MTEAQRLIRQARRQDQRRDAQRTSDARKASGAISARKEEEDAPYDAQGAFNDDSQSD